MCTCHSALFSQIHSFSTQMGNGDSDSRVDYLMMQKPERVRAFLIKYQLTTPSRQSL